MQIRNRSLEFKNWTWSQLKVPIDIESKNFLIQN